MEIVCCIKAQGITSAVLEKMHTHSTEHDVFGFRETYKPYYDCCAKCKRLFFL